MMIKPKIKISIAAKLVVITTFLLLVTTIPIALKSSLLFEDTSLGREDDMNINQATLLSEEVKNTLQEIMDKTKVVGTILYRNVATEAEREAALELSFRSDHDLVAVEVMGLKDGKPYTIRRAVNEEYLKQYDLKSGFMDSLRTVKPFPVSTNFAGDVEIKNSSFEGGAPLMTIGLPLVRDENGVITNIALADIRLDRIEKLFISNSERTSYLIDREGSLLAHSDEKLALTGRSLQSQPFIKEALGSKLNKEKKSFEDPFSRQAVAAAYAKTPFGVTVITEVPKAVILEPSQKVRRYAFLITGIALSLALFFIVLFSSTLTSPIENLVRSTSEVAKGNFDARARITTNDEVGELALAFNNMIDGLKERDKVKSLFGKFHGTGVANKLMTGEMKLGGEQREATVFFSDIRSFTAFSEKVSAQEVVDMLNEYFKIMVGIIQKNNGVVDKFIGDAIMAVWGAPESHGNDAANALKACLEMRVALAQLNKERLERGAPEIRIGMGIHTGPLIAGTIGSDDRMEYTVIGDTVNMASRIEAATKAYGTDLLVSEVTFEQTKQFFTFDEAGSAVVKGKSEPLKLFKVTGFINAEGQAVVVETAYSSYTAESVDKVHVA